jgi:hypothetical protein
VCVCEVLGFSMCACFVHIQRWREIPIWINFVSFFLYLFIFPFFTALELVPDCVVGWVGKDGTELPH